jgi:predicted Zn-dependent protease
VDKARNILSEAFAANPDNEDIWLAAFKLEFENQEPERARMILQKARDTETASTRRVWMKSAMVERELGNAEGERALLREGLQRFADFDKLHLMLGQLEERTGNVQGAGGMLSVWSAVGILPVLLFAMTLPHHRTPTIFVLPSVLQCENQKSISP